MSLRLVSAIWTEFYPFNRFNFFSEGIATSDPDDLQPGDALIVWGGGDIHPSLYNRKHSSHSCAGRNPSQRDIIEWALMKRAKELGIPIIGICRGAQMLCALEGGYLYQHVTGHGGTHEVHTSDGVKFVTNSIHHQMMEPENTKHEMYGWVDHRSKEYHDEDKILNQVEVEPELIYFPEAKGFAIQWHPEMMADSAAATKYICHLMENKLDYR